MKALGNDTALILVDIQNDFCPGGALAVREGDKIVPVVNRLIPLFHWILATQDWHPVDHCSFKAQGGPWPPHCVRGTRGAELHPALDKSRITHFVRKAFAQDADSYSEFSGFDEPGRSLDELLKSHDATTLYIVGLATDYCVRATVLDGLNRGYIVYAVTDAMRAVEVIPGDGETALREMAGAGAHLVTSEQIFRSQTESARTA
ncbi:MAG: bifunctional nicotinamidase/pyrazinamidase [Verrucomicrobiia bacterium]|jgi:nicotinamidase/pyrazinamidase